MDDIDVRMEVAVRTAREAGAILLRFFRDLNGYERKGRVNLVSEADKSAEAFLIRELRHYFPADGVIAEETEQPDWGQSGFVWVIDPLDGTTNFVHCHPHFCVSISLIKDGVPIIGVVYAPIYDELFCGVRGRGAYCNEVPISVSQTTSLYTALIASGFPYNREVDVLAPLLERVQRVLQASHGFRRAGSAALDMCYVAAGRLDAYWEEDVRAWDVAAGVVFVEEAGGRCTDLNGRPCDIFKGKVIASNSHIHDELLALLFDSQ
ncbi:MAG: inositol monophosphatase family protein [Myxococcota bacterium]|nr:inositol monophosphatase family protein [Myxococcota bacterium]